MVGAATRNFIGKARAHFEIEGIAHLRPVDLQNRDVI